VLLEGLSQLKSPVTSGIEPATFRFVGIPQPLRYETEEATRAQLRTVESLLNEMNK
jgi:hypothetical protein